MVTSRTFPLDANQRTVIKKSILFDTFNFRSSDNFCVSIFIRHFSIDNFHWSESKMSTEIAVVIVHFQKSKQSKSAIEEGTVKNE